MPFWSNSVVFLLVNAVERDVVVHGDENNNIYYIITLEFNYFYKQKWDYKE